MTLLKNCDKTLSWLNVGWILNDLAITQYHLRRPHDCLKTREPLAPDAALTDEDIRSAYPPADAKNYLPIVEATRTNQMLCRKLLKKRGKPARKSQEERDLEAAQELALEGIIDKRADSPYARLTRSGRCGLR